MERNVFHRHPGEVPDGYRHPVPPERHPAGPGPPSARSADSRASCSAAADVPSSPGSPPSLVAVGLSAAFGGEFKADYTAPGSDSGRPRTCWRSVSRPRPATRSTSSSTPTGAVTAPASGRAWRPARPAGQRPARRRRVETRSPAAGQRSRRTAGPSDATLRLDVVEPAATCRSRTPSRSATSPSRASGTASEVALGGQSVEQAEQGDIGSEGIGMVAAAIILLLMFGSVVAAGLPILVALVGLAVSSSLADRRHRRVVDAPDWSTSLAAMMGIGVGIDYVLLHGHPLPRVARPRARRREAATVATLDTAGRSVLVAGTTVIVSMLGLFAMGLSFMRGAAVVTILAVARGHGVAAMTLLPGAARLPRPARRPAAAPAGPARRGRRRRRARRAVARLAALEPPVAAPPDRGRARRRGVLLALAAPFLGVRFGFPDAGQQPGRHHHPAGLRPDRRRLRARRERPAAAGRRAAGRRWRRRPRASATSCAASAASPR